MRVARIITFLLLYYTCNVAADLSIRYDLVQAGNKHLPFHSIMIKRELVRINRDIDQASAVLLNLRTGDIAQLHNPSARYFEINAQTIDQYLGFYKQNRTLLQGLIDQGITQLNPQQREQLELFLNQYKKPATEDQFALQVTSKKLQLLGVDCTVVAVFEHSKLLSEVCMSDYQQLGFHSADIHSLELLRGFIQQFKQSAPRQHQQLFELIAQPDHSMSGLPMQVVNYRADGKVASIIQAGAISLRPIPEQTYRIPAGFQANDFPLL